MLVPRFRSGSCVLGHVLSLVRQGRLELPRYFYRQPLKLVRLPIPPLPRVIYEERPGEYQAQALMSTDLGSDKSL